MAQSLMLSDDDMPRMNMNIPIGRDITKPNKVSIMAVRAKYFGRTSTFISERYFWFSGLAMSSNSTFPPPKQLGQNCPPQKVRLQLIQNFCITLSFEMSRFDFITSNRPNTRRIQ